MSSFYETKYQAMLALCIPLMVGITVLIMHCGEVMAQPGYEPTVAAVGLGDKNDETTQGPVAEQRIDELIKQLGSASYAARQSAIEQLWLLSAQAKPALKRAAAEGDSEVSRRARQMLSVMALGIDTSTSPEIAKLVLHFHSSEQNVRRAVLNRLADEGEFQLVFDLLGQLAELDEQRELFESVMDFDDRLIELARADRWEDFEFILGHPITFEHQRAAGVHYHMVNGTLAPIIERLKQEIDSKANDGRNIEPLELLRLIAILRLQGQFDQAAGYAQKLTDDTQRFEIINQILMEQGDWQSIAKKMVGPDAVAPPGERKLVVTPAQRALVCQFIGDRAGYQNTVEELEETASEFEKLKDAEHARKIRESLVNIGLANLDWPLVESNLDRDDKRKLFRLYADHQRIEKAFEVIDLGTDVQRRNLWFNRRMRHIKTLRAKAIRLSDAGQDSDDVEREANEKLELCFHVTRLLGGLGLTDEAVLYYQTLMASLDGDEHRYQRISVISGLIQLERYEEAWNLIENGFYPAEYRQLSSYLFPNRHTTAGFWYGKLGQRYPNPMNRLRVTSGIVDSPLGTTGDFNLQVELAAAFNDPTNNRSGRVDYHLGKVFEFHGDTESSSQHMAMARELGDDTAKRVHALKMLEEGDFQEAIDFYDKAWLTRNGCFEAALAAEAYRKNGDTKQARLRDCLAYSFWRDAYRNTSTISSFLSIEKSYLIKDYMRLDIYPLLGNSNSNDRYRDDLAIIELESDPAASAINHQILLFQAASVGASRLPDYWSNTRKQINIALARAQIAQGRFQESLELLLQYNDFSPGDPGVGEDMIAELDRAGATEQADQLFRELTEVYFELLQRYPESPVHHNNYAWICASANRRTEHMLRHAEQACQQRPNTSTYLDTLAEVYFLLGDAERALEVERRCLQLNPTKRHYQKQVKRFEAACAKKSD